MPKYDLNTVKQTAEGRWTEIISSVCSIDAAVLDTRHHGCPKCGGNDRFRALDDFVKTGAVLCGQCHDRKNGDGLATVQWALNCSFPDAITKVAEFLGVKPVTRKRTKDPFEFLEELPWNPVIVGLWCRHKPGVTVDAIQKLGGKFCKYKGQYNVIAIPVWGPQLDAAEAVGWVMYSSDGNKLPRSRKGATDWVKVKLSEGSTKGIIANLDDWREGSDRIWWKVEGPTDLLTALSQDWPAEHAFFTTANGAKETPEEWMIESLAGCHVNVCHDADKPGQEGATTIELSDGRKRPGWVPMLAKLGTARNVCLPFPIEPTHGTDLRDYFNGGGTVQSLLEIAEKSETVDSEILAERTEDSEGNTAYVVRSVTDAKSLAQANLNYYRREHCRQLKYWRNEWYRYKRNRYERIDPEHLRLRVREFIQQHFERLWLEGEDSRDEVREVSRSLVDNVVDALKAECFLSPSIDLNSWLSLERPSECISFDNCILSLPALFENKDEDEFRFKHDPDWFSMQCLPYECDLEADCPNWQAFLNDVFSYDEEHVEALQRWFGYLLLDDCSLEKMLYIIGPTRSGKGTIMKVMMALYGENRVAAPALNNLYGQFALHSMYGKSIAIIPDARLSKKADREAITERLLSLVANDPQDIERKHLSTMNSVRMNMRFTLFSNKIPELNDSSAAMVGRGIYLVMEKSYLGKEDEGLLDRLLLELPGILNWAIIGRHKLQAERRIKQPKSADHLVRMMRVTMAPVAQFLAERCELGNNGTVRSLLAKDLFDAWCSWASEQGLVSRMNAGEFERRVIDAHPGVRTELTDNQGFSDRKLTGIGLRR